jgi:hypothetical protein
MTTALARRIIASQVVAAPAPAPPKTVRRFTVWGPSDWPAQYRSVEQICAQAWSLVPPGVWDEVELLVKAGEGGSWQSAFDPNPLAISSATDLAQMIEMAAQYGVRVSPYIVARGRPEWVEGEQRMIRDCVRIARRCNVNVEPGAPYWNGPKDPLYIRGYLAGADVPANTLEVTLIPRFTQVAELGGAACIQAWTDPTLVGSASWETYGLTAGISGPTSLLVDEAIPRLDNWGVPPEPQYRIPIPSAMSGCVGRAHRGAPTACRSGGWAGTDERWPLCWSSTRSTESSCATC